MQDGPEDHLEQNEHQDKHTLHKPMRIISLTDGVFSIIMTLLILEVKIPSAKSKEELKGQLLSTGFTLLIYVMSFLLAGVYWISHRVIFSNIKKVNTLLVWLNIIYLMICSVIPFGAALLARFPDDTTTLICYGIFLGLLAGWRLFIYSYVTNHHELLYAPLEEKRRKRVMRVMIFAPIMFFMSICLVPLSHTLSLVIYAVTPVIFATAISIVSNMPVKHISPPSRS